MTRIAAAHADTAVAPDGGQARLVVISVSTAAVLACAMLVYASGAFMATAILGYKREIEGVLLIPIAVAAANYVASRPTSLLSPLICFAAIKLVTEVALRGQWVFVLDNATTMLALIVLACAPRRSMEIGARFVVTLAGIWALMALIQLVALTVDPDLIRYVLVFADDEGGTEAPAQHPIALLGMVDVNQYSVLGLPLLRRMQSFAKEPSLNVAYFMFPAALGFLLNSRTTFFWACICLTFCVMSLSGSVFLALGLTAVCWLILRVVPIRFTIPYVLLIMMSVFLFAIQRFGSDPLLAASASMADAYGGFFSKTSSLTDRTSSAVVNAGAALAAPFGSTTLADLPGPMLINATFAAGWLGVLTLLWFFTRLGRELEDFDSRSRPRSGRRFGTLLLVGSVATILVFNDYQMGAYAGLILLAFIERTMALRNRNATTGRADPQKA